jgi:hypothetical protein
MGIIWRGDRSAFRSFFISSNLSSLIRLGRPLRDLVSAQHEMSE